MEQIEWRDFMHRIYFGSFFVNFVVANPFGSIDFINLAAVVNTMPKCKCHNKPWKSGNGKGSLKRHLNAMKARATRKENPDTIESTKKMVDWSAAGHKSWLTRRKNNISKELFACDYNTLSRKQKQEVDNKLHEQYSELEKEITNQPGILPSDKVKLVEQLSYAAVKYTIQKYEGRWQFVDFLGKAKRESSGIVDLLAIRKNFDK